MVKTIFLDLDDTILDFQTAERRAISETLRRFHIDPTPAVTARSHELNYPSSHCTTNTHIRYNPRSHEGNDDSIYTAKHDLIVSIHVPTRGTTQVVFCVDPYYQGFNPRSHEGNDT